MNLVINQFSNIIIQSIESISKKTSLGKIVTVVTAIMCSLYFLSMTWGLQASTKHTVSTHSSNGTSPIDSVHAGMLKTAEKVKIGTYNILFPQRTAAPNAFNTKIGYSLDKQGNLTDNIEFRMKVITKNLINADLDVVCIQEMTSDSFKVLNKNFSKKYKIVWVKHPKSFHGVGILYKKNKFNQLGKEETLNVDIPIPNPRQPTFIKSRAHLMVDLQDQTTQKIIRVVSCHLLDPRDLDDKSANVKEVVSFAEQIPSTYVVDHTIIAGDMNQDQFGDFGSLQPETPSALEASAFEPFIQHGYQPDDNLDSSEYDKEDFDNGPLVSKNRRIDWIWTKESVPQHLPLPKFDLRGSDHRLVAVTIQ